MSRIRPKGGEKNAKSGIDWARAELERVYELYITPEGHKIHETNPAIKKLAKELGRTVRSVENQLLGFRKVDLGETGRQNYNRLIPVIWKAKNETKTIVDNGFHFRISSALKDIIGRDLITDEYIAIFELVKNSYDAYATSVDIFFEDIYSNNAKIIIKDNGKGMDKDDLINKWLFLGYSAKKENEEDDSFDYRDSIYSNRPFAGAKGIGRFSCDRLGSNLYLETTKKVTNAKTEVLVTDWTNFEESSKEEFVNIGIEHKTKRESDYNLEHGTVLEITNLRTEWNREKLLKLKKSLAKLINPNRGKGEQRFKIILHVEEEKERDKQVKEEWLKSKNEDNLYFIQQLVNGPIENFVFETLGLKTTKIESAISDDGQYITTKLIEGGTTIYKIKERNENYKLLDNINCILYYLNRSAKASFARNMGVPSKDYGHVFLYKNEFRIYPYGEPGEDPLKIDLRKGQGQRRHLGTRELIGQIEIFSDTDQFRETSSRGDGLIKTESYLELEEFFWSTLKRLERYVVGVQKWGLSIEEDEEVRTNVVEFITKLTDSSSIIEFEYPDNFDQIILANQPESLSRLVKNLKRLAKETDNDDLLIQVEKTEKQLEEIRLAKEEAEREAEAERRNAEEERQRAEAERRKAEEAIKEAEQKESENLFLRSVKSQDFDEIVSFLHHIGINAGTVDNYLSGLHNKLMRGNIDIDKIAEIIKLVILENKKIQNISRFATKANFKLYTDAIELNLNEYLQEYLKNIVALDTNDKIHVSYDSSGGSYIKKIRPIEINILIDNLLSNSKKAGANIFKVTLNTFGDKAVLILEDDGKGMSDANIDAIFKYGYTTNTSGSGIGLYHVKQIVDRFGGKIKVESVLKQGTKFIIEL